jgi:DivIVA domain-containing protein
VRNVAFSKPRLGGRGYNDAEVDAFLDRVLRVAVDDDDGVIEVDEDRVMRTAPLGVVSGGRGGCGDGAVGSLTGLLSSRRGSGSIRCDLRDGYAGCFLVDDGVIGGEGGGERLQGQVVDRAGVTAGGVVDQPDRVLGSENRVSARPVFLQWW